MALHSTIVETVSIDYEDFNDTYLTCATCLCVYDGVDHTPKLLPCSHTVCLQCLDRIVATFARDTGQFRCPICRELITIPQRGGVSALPPSFLVNQLLDLMARQRREVVPKCSTHNNQELLFCETCDVVFCKLCTGGSHRSSFGSGGGGSSSLRPPPNSSGRSPDDLISLRSSLTTYTSASTITSKSKSKRRSRTLRPSHLNHHHNLVLTTGGGGYNSNGRHSPSSTSTKNDGNSEQVPSSSTGGATSTSSGSTSSPLADHTVIPFSVAIKRMNEILLYKANECRAKLEKANDAVTDEINLLDRNADETYAAVNACFKAISEQVEAKRLQVLEQVRVKKEEKRKVLQEQLDIIRQETGKVNDDVKRSQHQVDVRNLTKTISDLNCKLDTLSTLQEPRENSFIEFNFPGQGHTKQSTTLTTRRSMHHRYSPQPTGGDVQSTNIPPLRSNTISVPSSSTTSSRLQPSVAPQITVDDANDRRRSLQVSGESNPSQSVTRDQDSGSSSSEVVYRRRSPSSAVFPSANDGSSSEFVTRITSLLSTSNNNNPTSAMKQESTENANSFSKQAKKHLVEPDVVVVRTSKTFPALCSARLLLLDYPLGGKEEDSSIMIMDDGFIGHFLVAKLSSTIRITTVDYNGQCQVSGGDPVEAQIFQLCSDFSEEGEEIVGSEQQNVVGEENQEGVDGETKNMTDVSESCELDILDRWDGTYDITFIPQIANATYCLKISIFKRPIKDCPIYFDVTEHNSPVLSYPLPKQQLLQQDSSKSEMDFQRKQSNTHQIPSSSLLSQPCAIAVSFSGPDTLPWGTPPILWVLDTGNCKLRRLDGSTLQLLDSCESDEVTAETTVLPGMENRSATGIAIDGGRLFILNWRSKSITQHKLNEARNEIDENQSHEVFTHSELKEPTAIAVDGKSKNIIVADSTSILVFKISLKRTEADQEEADSKMSYELVLLNKFGGKKGVKRGEFHSNISALACDSSGERVVVADSRRLQVFNFATGVFIREIPVTANQSLTSSSRSSYGGLSFDSRFKFLLATKTGGGGNNNKSSTMTTGIHVFDYESGVMYSTIDSFGAKLKRPLGLAVLPPLTLPSSLWAGDYELEDKVSLMDDQGLGGSLGEMMGSKYVVVVDVGSDCVRKLRFL